MIVDCGDEAFVLLEDLDLEEDFEELEGLAEDESEDVDSLEAGELEDSDSAAAGAAGSGVTTGSGAGADSAGVETAAVAPDPEDPVSSPEANAGTVAGITSNMQKIRIVAIFDR
jgi:hypothetical protein